MYGKTSVLLDNLNNGRGETPGHDTSPGKVHSSTSKIAAQQPRETMLQFNFTAFLISILTYLFNMYLRIERMISQGAALVKRPFKKNRLEKASGSRKAPAVYLSLYCTHYNFLTISIAEDSKLYRIFSCLFQFRESHTSPLTSSPAYNSCASGI